MSNRVCFYFQVHQPYRLRDLRVTDIGAAEPDYFDDVNNRKIFRKVAEKCYLPANALLLQLIDADPEFRVSFSLSGVFLDQCQEYGRDVLKSFKALAKTGQVEFLGETDCHSLSALKSTAEFCAQVKAHSQKIHKHFGRVPKVFRNTELIYSNDLANQVRLLGFRGMLAEGVDRLLGDRHPGDPVVPPTFRLPRPVERTIAAGRSRPLPSRRFHVLLKHYRLSDDVAFRFSDKNWASHPLSAETFAGWVKESPGHGVNLFMDYETFGEHQWAESGIFDFLGALPAALKREGIASVTPSQSLLEWKGESDTYDAHEPISWADSERDLSAWQGNAIQQAALDNLYALEEAVLAANDEDLLSDWRRLQTSDHFYYMCTKYWADGDVHKYFSPYDSPYEAYRRFSHALCDLQARLARIPSSAL